ncbi:hypothetical protein [Mesorhizobium sp. M1406]|uniref:hypothetical protein n=1 Tax=Mesorhizobium sp. M1406 TaxID=2957099 RepID=UPI00333AF508
MPAITRRTLLALTGAAVAVDPVSAEVRVSPKLQALIAAHEAAYAAFHRIVNRAASSRDDRARADRNEQVALLAICGQQSAEATAGPRPSTCWPLRTG